MKMQKYTSLFQRFGRYLRDNGLRATLRRLMAEHTTKRRRKQLNCFDLRAVTEDVETPRQLVKRNCVILLPVYNGSEYLEKTLNSILAQDYPDYCLIVCNDCSTDASARILDRYAPSFGDKLIRLSNPENYGVGYTVYRTYSQYHGASYFAMLGHDDIWPPDFLSSQIQFLQEHNYVAAFSAYRYIDEKDDEIFAGMIHNETVSACNSPALFLNLLIGNFLCAASSMVALWRVDADEMCDFWGRNNDKLQDYELWLHLLLRGDFGYNPAARVSYRIHAGSLSSVRNRPGQEILERYGVLRRVLFSTQFALFLSKVTDPVGYAEQIVHILVERTDLGVYGKVLTMDFCEWLISQRLASTAVYSMLNKIYAQLGAPKKKARQDKL